MTQADSHSIGDQYRRGKDELRDISEELAGIAADMRNITRTEVELAKTELREQFSLLKTAAVWGGVGALMALVSIIFGFTALMFALDEVMPLWAAALVTFGAVLLLTAIAGGIAFGAVKKITVVPTKTISSVKEDVRWAGTQVRSSMTSSASETR